MINIIKKQNLVEVVRLLPSGEYENHKFPYSGISISLLRDADADIMVFTGKKLRQKVALQDVTIQGGDGLPVQATVDNWDELAGDLIKSEGGAGGVLAGA
jgi:hypothetical protein